MALTDISAPNGDSNVLEFARGDIGTVVDISAQGENVEEIPIVTGGSGGDYVFVS
jgi:hypothetical protein